MKQILKLTLSIMVVAVLAFDQHAAEAELQPVRIDRQSDGGEVVFRLADDAPGTLAAQSLPAERTGEPQVPAFYLFPVQHREMVAVSRFVDTEGRMRFATAPTDVDALRRRGMFALDQPLFLYERRVEGSSELFRLQNPVTGAEFYTVDAQERLQRLADGWRSLPSLGWTQAIDSSGVGILKDTTIKLQAPELDALTAVRGFGRELTFGTSNEVIASLRPGTIVYAEKSEALPLGLVHRVDWVTPDGDGVIVATSPVDLMEAFEEVHLFLQGTSLVFLSEEQFSGDWVAPDCRVGTLKLADCRTPRVNGAFDGTVRKEFNIEWKTKSKGLEGKLTVSGGSSLGVTIEGQYSNSNMCSTNPPVATFVITPHQDYKISVEASGVLAKEKEKKVFTPITGTVPLAGIPLSATFTLWAGYEASAGITAKVEFAEKAQGTAVLQWDRSKRDLKAEICPKSCPAGFRCGPSSKPPSKTCSIIASLSGEAGFEGTASVYLRPEIFLYLGAVGSGAGPYVDAKFQLQARTERYATEAYAQFIPSAGAKMKIGCVEMKAGLTYNPPNGFQERIASIPVAPTGVDASDGKVTGKVTIKWKEVPGVTGYEVYRSTSATGTKTKLTSKLVSSAKYEDSVKAPAKYHYWIRAVTNKMKGPYSKSDVGWAK